MNSDNAFDAGQEYTVHHDDPKRNGSTSNGPQRLSAEQELIAAILTRPALLAVVSEVGLQEAHFVPGSGLRGAFRFAPQGAERIWQILEEGYSGSTFDVLAFLVELNVRIGEQRAERLARAIIGRTQSRSETSGKEAQSGTANTRRNEKPNIHSWNSPDWSILDERRGTLPEFPLDLLPPACRDWTSRAAHGAGVTVGRLLGMVFVSFVNKAPFSCCRSE